jgi:Tol biopolymer transport system component
MAGLAADVAIWALAASEVAAAELVIPGGGRLAFHSYTAYDLDDAGRRHLDGRIHICDFPADSPRRLPEIERHVRHAMNPLFSADGVKMTFMALPLGPEYDADWVSGLDVFVYDFRTDTLTNVSKRAGLGRSIDEDPIFSAQGDAVIFKCDRADLWKISLISFRATAITSDGKHREESGPRISPDGQWLAYWHSGGKTADVYRMPIRGGKSELLAGKHGVQEMFPVYLDKRSLAYTRWTDADSHDDEVFVLNLTTGKHHSAAFNSTNGANDSDPFPIAGLVGYSSDRTENGKGGWDLYLGDPNKPTPIFLRNLSTRRHDLGGTYTPHVVNSQ